MINKIKILFLILILNLGLCLDLPTEVKAYWKADEASGVLIDVLNTYPCAQSGTVGSVAGKIGGARGPFSALNYLYWSAGGASNTWIDKNLFLIEFWFKTPDTGANQWIIGKGENGANNGWGVYPVSSDKIRTHIQAVMDLDSTASLVNNAWHYYVLYRPSAATNQTYLYIDGVYDKAGGNGNNMTASVRDFRIGVDGVGNIPHTGDIDEIAYWDLSSTSKTKTQIEAIITERWNGGVGKSYGADGYNFKQKNFLDKNIKQKGQ